MMKILFASVVFVLAGIMITSPCSAQKITYKGTELKTVTFDYFKNWEIKSRPGYVTLKIPGQAVVIISEELNQESIPDAINHSKKNQPNLKKTIFNGYEAYYVDGEYILYRGNMEYVIRFGGETEAKNITAQMKTIMASIKFK
jgi:hypothetical protein